ncbi:MAG TPA: ABC transporter substrate-binding protein, partial [Candidatus Limnocylindrales bacterium]|nr:ABC transporter substrate-binding protein [Candidatus Limnocylindrales bacterium]
MRFARVAALGAAVLVAVAACSSGGGGSAKPDIKIGSDSFYESKLVAEMFAQVLEADGYKVTRNLGIGARQVRQPALEQGQIDLSPEYVGSGLGYYDAAAPTGDGPTNREALAKVLEPKGISVTAISPGEDTNAAVVRQDTADQYGLAKMSDLAAVQDELKWGLPPDCDANPLCKGALESYGITYPPKQREALAACDAPIAEALNNKGVDFAWLCSTQPAIAQFGFVVLDDDKNTQPAENMTALVRDAYLDTVGD